MDWDAIRAYSTKAAYDVFSVPAVYTDKSTGISYPVETVFNENFEVRDEAGFVQYKPVAKVRMSSIPEPRENSVFVVNSQTLLVDFYKPQANHEWVLFLKERSYGGY